MPSDAGECLSACAAGVVPVGFVHRVLEGLRTRVGVWVLVCARVAPLSGVLAIEITDARRACALLFGSCLFARSGRVAVSKAEGCLWLSRPGPNAP